MSTELKLRRGTTLEHESFTGANGEVTFNTSKRRLVAHDGVEQGGYEIGGTFVVSDIKDLLNFPLIDGAQYSVTSYLEGWAAQLDPPSGGGVFLYDSTRSKDTNNGGLVIAPEAIAAWDGTHSNITSILDWTGAAGDGCFVKQVGTFVTPYDFGGVVNDASANNSPCIKKGLTGGTAGALKEVVIPQGDWYISDTIALNNQRKIRGVNSAWAANDDRLSTLVWNGASGGVMIQAAREPFGTESVLSLSAIFLDDLRLDGMNVAGIGLYGAACRDDSRFNSIVAYRCNLFGMLFEGDHYYVEFDRLIAKDCLGVGIAFGYNYDNVFTNSRFNGAKIGYLRANQCGQLYDAVTAPTGFHIDDNPKGGCGIYSRLKSTTGIAHIVSEGNYGPGLTVETLGTSVNHIGSTYLETNGDGAFADGASPVAIEALMIDSNSTKNCVRLSELNIEGSGAGVIYYLENGGNSEFVFENVGRVSIDANVSGQIPFTIPARRGEVAVASGIYLNNDELYSTGRILTATHSEMSGVDNSRLQAFSVPAKINFASGDTLNFMDLSLRAAGILDASVASAIVSVSVLIGTGTDINIRTKTFSVTIAAGKRFSSAPSTNVSVTEISSHTANLSGSGFALDDFDLDVSFDGGNPTQVATLSVTPTWAGAYSDTRATLTILNSGMGLGGSDASIRGLIS